MTQPLFAAAWGVMAALVVFVVSLRAFRVIAPGDALLIRLQPDPEESPT
jgi:hypothetical protein